MIVQLDSMPGYSFGFQLRLDAQRAARRGMLDRLRDAMRRDTLVRLEYVRTGFRNGLLTARLEPALTPSRLHTNGKGEP